MVATNATTSPAKSERPDDRHLRLLVALVLLALVQPLAPGFTGGFIVFDVLFSLVLAGVVVVVFRRLSDQLVALALMLPAIATRLATNLSSGELKDGLTIAHHATVILFLGFATITILRGVVSAKAVTADHVRGAICGWLLAGAMFGSGYALLEIANPRAFSVAPSIAAQITSDHYRTLYFNYYSMCILTGAPPDGIATNTVFAGTIVWLEAAFGLFYLAILVAQLLGLKMAR